LKKAIEFVERGNKTGSFGELWLSLSKAKIPINAEYSTKSYSTHIFRFHPSSLSSATTLSSMNIGNFTITATYATLSRPSGEKDK
jgi:hypothetical protein